MIKKAVERRDVHVELLLSPHSTLTGSPRLSKHILPNGCHMNHGPQVEGIHNGRGDTLLHLPHAVRTDRELLLWQLDADDATGDRAQARPRLVGGPL